MKSNAAKEQLDSATYDTELAHEFWSLHIFIHLDQFITPRFQLWTSSVSVASFPVNRYPKVSRRTQGASEHLYYFERPGIRS